MEEYPSLAEGVGLENRKGVTAAGVRIPLPPPFELERYAKAYLFFITIVCKNKKI